MPVECPYCKKAAVLTDGERIYPHRPDLHDKQFYACFGCKAWVGCHAVEFEFFAPTRIDGEWEWDWHEDEHADVREPPRPFGSLANAELRALRSRVHSLLDPLWLCEPRGHRRGVRRAIYATMAGYLGISVADCHVGMFREEQCRTVLAWLTFSYPPSK